MGGILDMIIIWVVHFLQTTEGQSILNTVENELLAAAEAAQGTTPPTPPPPGQSTAQQTAPPIFAQQSSDVGMVTP